MKNRRDFLKLSALASGTLLMPNFLQCMGQSGLQANGKKLVILQLSGGCDGLNAFVPYQNDLYYNARPVLAIPKNKVLKLNDEIGLNPALSPLKSLYDSGQMTLVNSVGYPNPNRSHFRSMDIWHSGSDAHEYWDTGWLGRYLDHSCTGCAEPHKILEVDDTLSLAVKGQTAKGLAVRNPKQLHRATQDRYLKDLTQAAQSARSQVSDLDFMYKTLTETMSSTQYIYEASNKHTSRTVYPQNQFAKGLKMVAELIISGVETSVFYLSLSGFDTHSNQKNPQNRLLKVYADSVAAFIKDLKKHNQLDDTLIMTFSEFGRRVKQNASNGTDHGKANNLMLMGGNLRAPGIFNSAPDLENLDDGDLAFQVDFRQVYAEILDRWLEADSEQVLGKKFRGLGIV